MASLNFTEVENRTARSGLSNGVVYYKSGAEVWHGLRSVSVREYSGPANYIYLDGQPISVDNQHTLVNTRCLALRILDPYH